MDFSITQVDVRPLERLVFALPEVVLGINGPYLPRNGALGRKPYHRIHITGSRTLVLVGLVEEYLSEPKLEQIAAVLARVNGG